MDRIFVSLAISSLIVLSASAALGLMVQDSTFYAAHFGLSLFSVILTALIHVIVFTYFTVTGKMIVQAVSTGHLDDEPLQRVRDYKLRVTRCLGSSVAAILLVMAFGALSDGDSSWHLWHFAAAMLMLGVNAGAFYIEYGLIVLNRIMMGDVLERYNALKPDQGT